MGLSIIFAEDDDVQRHMLSRYLRSKTDFTILEARHGQEAVELAQSHELTDLGAILLDLNMPVLDGFGALGLFRTICPEVPVIILTADEDPATAVQAIKLGAIDYLNKPIDKNKLIVTLQNAIKLRSLHQEVVWLQKQKEGNLQFQDLIGARTGLAPVVSIGRKAAVSDIPVLITGATGTGKELFARALHGESRRCGQPFVPVNCGAIPAGLIESTLFGHEKGAFTGAVQSALGKFREANNGTLFLDEVGELPPDAQVRLLRALQQQEVEPVGAGMPVKVNVRIIAATNRDLAAEVNAGRFRPDLFFRLHVLPIQLPSLHERKQDIALLAQHFLRNFATTHMLPSKILSKSGLGYLEKQHWPGNVRELENLIYRAMIWYDTPELDGEQLKGIHQSAESVFPQPAADVQQGLVLSLLDHNGLWKPLTQIEHEILQQCIQFYEGHVPQAAAALGMAKSTFYRKMEESGQMYLKPKRGSSRPVKAS